MAQLFVFVFPWIGFFIWFTAVTAKQRSTYFQLCKTDTKMYEQGFLKELQTRSIAECVAESSNYKTPVDVLYNHNDGVCKLYDHSKEFGLQDDSGWRCWQEAPKLKLVLSKKTWEDAAKDCSDQGHELAIIDSKMKHDTAKKLITDRGLKDFIWLGATDVEKEGRWLWANSQELMFAVWSPFESQPNDYLQNQDCLAVIYRNQKISGWFDKGCSNEFYYLCEA